MAEIVASAVIGVLCEKLISGDLMKLARFEQIDSQLNKWKNTLPMIQAVLADAGQKQIKERAVQLWLENLQDLAYDIDDVLDDLATEAMRRKLDQESQASTSKVLLKFIPKCCTTFIPGNITYGRQVSSKLNEITKKLGELVERKNDLGLNVNVTVEMSYRSTDRLQTSLVDEYKIIGRDGDKEMLLGKLLRRNDNNVGIVSIVGLGGIGKTTLAQLLYNDGKVKDHFEHRAWVCVSEECDVFEISKSIFQAVTGVNKDFADLNLLHEALKEKLSKKRFLIVLDDVWNEDHSKWELLKRPLVGAAGSKILVTTRNTQVAKMMDSDEAYDLMVLSKADALSLLAQHALGEKNFDNHPSLELHGEAMVQKCGRLPLALKALGRLLKRNRNGDEWEKVLNSEIWSIPEGSNILPALRVSYYHLSPQLKLMFAYCSLFPKDHVFDKNDLVLLWMAEGFLTQSDGIKSMESLGLWCFEELKSMSFFQHSTSDEYTMHDLINDLATSVAENFFFKMDDKMDAPDTNELFEKFRHFSLIGPRCTSYRKLKELQRATRSRTFLLVTHGRDDLDVLDKLLPELQFLRVLSVAYYDITKVPQSIGSLKHLRYLNFSYTNITCLPEQVSHLYNLQSLLVHNCYKLSSLPESFAKLINLRHLDIRYTPELNKMPLGIGGLTSLQTLSKVIIGRANRFKISDLKRLSDLRGELFIMGLDKVINPIQAKDADLHQKKGLDVLEMIWSEVSDDSQHELIQYEVLQELRPHHKLRNLKIWYYNGPRFPSWVGDPSFEQLTELTLRGCRSTHLPTLGQLPSLEKLFVESMYEVKTVGFELLAPTNSSLAIAFPSLEVLKFDDMQGWERWSTTGGVDNGTARLFPRLSEISIKNCPKLAEVSIGSIPSLQVLHIKGCSEAVLRSMVSVSSSLVVLKMLNVKGLTQLHEEVLMHLRAVEILHIDRCYELTYLWEPESEANCEILMSLQKLRVRYCTKLLSIIGGMESLKEVEVYENDALESFTCPNSVERLVIECCESMKSLTFSTMSKLPSDSILSASCDNIEPSTREHGFRFLPSFHLRFLRIDGCTSLESFPHEYFQSFTSLEEMSITSCPSMEYSFPSGLWPPSLRSLDIGLLRKPMSQWGPQNFPTTLISLTIYGQDSGVVSFGVAEDVRNTTNSSSSFLLPPSLVELTLVEFEHVESLSEVLQHLPCLKRLEIRACPKLSNLHETTSIPSSLSLTVSPYEWVVHCSLADDIDMWSLLLVELGSKVYAECNEKLV